MKTIILALAQLNSFLASAMLFPKERRKSHSPTRMNTLMIRHRSQSSLADNQIRTALPLKPDESTPSVDALITARRAPEQSTAVPAAVEKKDTLDPSRKLKERAAENNRTNFTKMMLQAHEAIRNIKAENDTAYKQYKSNIKYARYYYTTWMTLEITEDPSALSHMVDQELKPLQDAFDKKIASLR